MNNLVQNSQWEPGPTGGPLYFSGTGPVTYDDFYFEGNRSCSVTIPSCDETTASDHYDVAIPVRGHCCILWGYILRAIQVGSILLRADFYDRNEQIVHTETRDVSRDVCSDFKEVYACFSIPQGAESVKLSMEFASTVTACTFCAPFACFAE